MESWSGDVLDDLGIVRLCNPDGSRPPLIWCFNAQHEADALAALLGPDQPLIALRSLHLVARLEAGRGRLDIEMGDYYADILLNRLGDARCVIGGNCQGVAVATQIARRWLLMGRRCAAFISMESEPLYPLPVPCTLLYGAESEQFNPHLRGDTGAAGRWRLMVANPVQHSIPGGHGQYFGPENSGALVAAIRRVLEGPAAPPPPVHRLRLRLETPPARVAPGGRIDLGLQVEAEGGGLPAGLMVGHIWRDAETGDVQHVAGQPVEGEVCRLTLAAPATPGLWEILLFPTLPPHGPLSWHAHLDPIASLRVSEPDLVM